MKPKFSVLFGALAAVLLLAFGWLMLAQAATLRVNTVIDSTSNNGYCTLREAIINANNNAATWPDCPAGNGADTIYLTGLSGEIVLLSDLPALTDPAGLTIQGPGADILTLSGNGFYRLFKVENAAPFTVRDITLARGSDISGAGGSAINAVTGSSVEIWNSQVFTHTSTAVLLQGGSLTVVGSAFRGNTGNSGAAIYAPDASTVLVDNSTFIGNQASYGHAIFKANGSLTLNNSRFEQNGSPASGFGTVAYTGAFDIVVRGCQFVGNQVNRGGALYDAGGGGTIHIENSQFVGNTASYVAGAIRSGGFGVLEISHSTFIENSALEDGGVIISYAPMTITASTFYSNTAQLGGVIFTYGDASGPITILDSYFQGNHATNSGGAIWYGRGLYVTNSTFYGNTADYGGGALASISGWGEIVNSTFDRNGANNGASLYFGPSDPPVTLRNTIIANPQWGNHCYTYMGSYLDGGYNLQYPGSSCNPAIPILDPLLDPAGPQENGGSTRTIALQSSSPAIDRVPAGGDCPASDQRGAPRPVDGNGSSTAECDSGAYEYSSLVPTPTPTTAPTATPAPTLTPSPTPSPTPVPVLQLSKIAQDLNGDTLLPGDTLHYTITVTNPYGFAVANVTLNDTIPAYTTYVADSDTPEADADTDPLVWSAQTIPPGNSTYTFDVTVDADAGGQTIVNTACLNQIGAAQQCTAPIQPPGGGDVVRLLMFSKTAQDLNGYPLLPGDIIRYTLILSNPYASVMSGITLSDSIPAYTAYVPNSDTPEAEADADPLVWRNQTVSAHSYNEYQFEVTVLPNAGGQRIENSACVQQTDLALRCTAPIVPPAPGGGDNGGRTIPQLSFGKIAQDLNGLPLTVGDVIRYTLLITNPHQVSVSGVVVTDSLPAHTTYVPNSDTPEAAADTDPLVWSNLLIPPGVTTLTFEVTVNPQTYGEVIRNQACLQQAGLPPTCTPLVEPPGNGVVKRVMHLPVVLNNDPLSTLKSMPRRWR